MINLILYFQSADAQRETASQTIDLIKVVSRTKFSNKVHKCLLMMIRNVVCLMQYLMEFNSSPGDLMELSPLFSDDNRVAEAASIAQKLSK